MNTYHMLRTVPSYTLKPTEASNRIKMTWPLQCSGTVVGHLFSLREQGQCAVRPET